MHRNSLTYAEVEYLYISREGNCRVNTGIVSDNETGMELTFSFGSLSEMVLAGHYAANNHGLFIAKTKECLNVGWGMDTIFSIYRLVNHEQHTCSMNIFNSRKIVYDSTLIGTASSILQGGEMLVFEGGRFPVKDTRLVSLKITKGETLVRDFRPVVRIEDGEAGLLDVANMVFYSNLGTGVLVPGSHTGRGW